LPRQIISVDLAQKVVHLLPGLVELRCISHGVELRMVESVECFHAELHGALFALRKVLEQADVPVVHSGPAEGIRRRIAGVGRRRRTDRARVEKLIEGPFILG